MRPTATTFEVCARSFFGTPMAAVFCQIAKESEMLAGDEAGRARASVAAENTYSPEPQIGSVLLNRNTTPYAFVAGALMYATAEIDPVVKFVLSMTA